MGKEKREGGKESSRQESEEGQCRVVSEAAVNGVELIIVRNEKRLKTPQWDVFLLVSSIKLEG